MSQKVPKPGEGWELRVGGGGGVRGVGNEEEWGSTVDEHIEKHTVNDNNVNDISLSTHYTENVHF